MSAAGSARALAARAVARVARDNETLEAALAGALGADERVPRAAVRSLSFGAVRGWFRHEALLQLLLTSGTKSLDPLVRALLSVALYEIEDARSPEYAVVDAAVETARAVAVGRASGLVNAVLRRYLRERTAIDSQIARDPAARHAAPRWLRERLRQDWPGRCAPVLAAMDSQAPMWLRVDARRATGAAYLDTLRRSGRDGTSDPRWPQAVSLSEPCDVHELPGFDAGLVSVQDLAAQCVASPLALAPGLKVLDACAAPGGKTALIAESEPRLGALTAVDIDASRLTRVRENLERGGLEAEILQGDAGEPWAWWNGQPFDRILLDAPCSALGVARRHPDVRLRKSPFDIDKMTVQQTRLLRSGWPLLKRGGRLVYATCTFTRAENHDVIAAFLEATPDASPVPPADWEGWPGLGEGDGIGRQILPGEAGADGFYYAALTKR